MTWKINNAIGVKRNRTPQEDKWTRKNNIHKIMTGQEYVGFQRKGNVVEHNVIRKSRSLGSMYFYILLKSKESLL